MGADNWRCCEACEKSAADSRLKRREKAMEQYGKITPEAFTALMAKLDAPIEQGKETLREDYDFYVNDGVFHAVYRGECQACGFLFTFRHQEPYVAKKASDQ